MSQFDSNILQLLGIPGWILVPPVTQVFRSKWLHFSFSEISLTRNLYCIQNAGFLGRRAVNLSWRANTMRCKQTCNLVSWLGGFWMLKLWNQWLLNIRDPYAISSGPWFSFIYPPWHVESMSLNYPAISK